MKEIEDESTQDLGPQVLERGLEIREEHSGYRLISQQD